MFGDIHSHAERRDASGKWTKVPDLAPFHARSATIHGWLADVRNEAVLPPIAARRGLPTDLSTAVARNFMGWEDFAHSMSWVGVDELLAFDYDAAWLDSRTIKRPHIDPWVNRLPPESRQGTRRTFRELLGDEYFRDLENLQIVGAERVVFWFDS